MTAEHFEDSGGYVRSVARAIRVPPAFDNEMPSGSLSRIADHADLPRAVARRPLLTLQHLGYVGSRGRSFFPTLRVLELGHSYPALLDMTELAQQSMERLSQQVTESCSMAVLDGQDIVCVLHAPVRRVTRIAIGVGARLPAFATSMGRVILADLTGNALNDWLNGQNLCSFTPWTLHAARALKDELARVRRQGYALVSRELEYDLCSIAVPIHAVDGCVVAALNAGMPYDDDAPERAVKEMLPALREAQTAVEQAIARVGWIPQMAMRSAHA